MSKHVKTKAFFKVMFQDGFAMYFSYLFTEEKKWQEMS